VSANEGFEVTTDPDDSLAEGYPDASPARESRWSDARIAGVLFLALIAIYMAVTTGQQYAYDGNSMLAVTVNLFNHGSLTTGDFVDPFHLSVPYSPYGIAMSLLGLIPYGLSKVFGHPHVLIAVVTPVLTALAAVVMYRIARSLGWRPIEGMMAAISFGVLSMAVQYTTEYFSEPGVTLCVLVMVLGIIHWGQRRPYAPLVVGVAAGAALQFRSDSLITIWIALVAVPLFVPWRKLVDRRALALLCGPLVVSAVVLVAYNELRYSKILVSSYGGSFVTPLEVGLRGLLASPGKSLFVFNPLALLGVVGLGLLFVRNRPVAVLFTLLIVPRIIFFARWSSWQGGWAWGPRFLLPIVPLLMLAAVEVIRATRRSSVAGIATRLAAAVLAVASLAVQVLSVRIPYQQWLQVSAEPTAMARLDITGPLSPNQWLDQTEFHISASPIWGDVELIRHHLATMAPLLWSEGHGLAGSLLIGVGLVLLGSACFGASGRRDHNREVRKPANSSDDHNPLPESVYGSISN
jgi:hypothetical protein